MNLAKTIEQTYTEIKESNIKKIGYEEKILPLVRAYRIWLTDFVEKDKNTKNINDASIFNTLYVVANGMIKVAKEEYSQEEIKNFSVHLMDFQSSREFYLSGLFLSALVNVHYERTRTKEKYEFLTHHLVKKIDCMGHSNNGANVLILGDVGDFLGEDMKKGKIRVSGDAGCSIGNFMSGGRISVQNAQENVGELLSGGTIEVRGNAGQNVGCEMNGGTILLLGDYTSIDEELEGGRIIHKGKRIYDFGK